MRLAWDAIGRVDLNIVLFVRVIYEDKVQDGRVTDNKRDIISCPGI